MPFEKLGNQSSHDCKIVNLPLEKETEIQKENKVTVIPFYNDNIANKKANKMKDLVNAYSSQERPSVEKKIVSEANDDMTETKL